MPGIRGYVFDPEAPAPFLGLDVPDAMASFAFLQWIQLEWEMPDAIIPMPDSDSLSIGKAFAKLIDRPFVRALFSDCSYKENRLEDNNQLLVFDVSNPKENLEKAALALSESFPKRIYLLSLYPAC